MQLFELVSPRLFRPLAGPNRAFYAELLLLLWEECRHTADYSISRAEAVSRAEDYFAALAKPLTLDADGAGDEEEQPTRDPHTLARGFLLRLRRTGWLEEQPGSYESEPTLAFVPEVAPLLDALEEILNPRVVTYTGKLYKAWQLLQGVGEEKNPYENVLREVASDLEALNKSLRALNASIGHYIDRLTRNRTPQEVLELFDQYEEKVVAAAYHRFKTSDNLFNYRAYLEEGLDACEETYLPQLALDYARVERCAPGEAAPRVRALIQQQRDALEEMSTLIREIDASHIRYRKRAVQRAQFLLLSDRSSQGSVTALLRRYAEDIRTPDQLFEPDDGPVAAHLHLYPAPLQAAALVNEHEGSQARLLKYESILLLVLRLLYLQKRESLAASADQVLVTVEEVQTELQKMNLPRRLDQQTLERLMRTLRRYNLARPVGRLSGLDSRIEVFPTVLLALPDADLADAAAESARTRTELGLYERPEGADTEAGEAEA